MSYEHPASHKKIDILIEERDSAIIKSNLYRFRLLGDKLQVSFVTEAVTKYLSKTPKNKKCYVKRLLLLTFEKLKVQS